MRRSWIAGAISWLAAPLTWGGNFFNTDWQEQPMAFSLDLGVEEIQVGTADQQAHVYRAGGEFVELAYPWLQAGLMVGSMLVDEAAESITGASELTGYDAGLHLKSVLPLPGGIKIGAYADYRYAQADAKVDGTTVEMHWHHMRAKAGGFLPLWHFGLGAGVGVSKILLRQKNNLGIELHPPDQTNKFAFAMIDLRVNEGGHVGVELAAGEQRSYLLYFQRLY